MSMTREEKIKRLEALKARCERLIVSSDRGPEEWRRDAEALDLTLTALRPVSREQVEKVWRGEWDYSTCEWNLPKCPKCGCNSKDAMYGHKNNFCPRCGEAMTDEAVQMVMERLEALHESP